ncbi:hypothetical protein DXG01_002681 [Tephrocybe rancida]|nr:hypothetical protein DXG01_002681 [Tephrocybe rancida]
MAQPKPSQIGSFLPLALAAMFHRPTAGPEPPEGLTTPNTAFDSSAGPSTSRATLREGPIISARRSSTGNVDDRLWSKGANDSSASPQLSRSGLLQPMSYNPPNTFGTYDNHMNSRPHHSNSPHSQDTIRERTMKLSSISFSSSSPMRNGPYFASDGPSSFPLTSPLDESPSHQPTSTAMVVTSSPLAHSRQSSGETTPRLPFQPSGLSLLRHEYESGSASGSEGSRTPTTPPDKPAPAPRVHWTDADALRARSTSIASTTPVAALANMALSSPEPLPSAMTETTPLIRRMSSSSATSPARPSPPHHASTPKNVLGTVSLTNVLESIPHTLEVAFKSIPAVLLGSLLNILDGVSYGMIIFPGTGVFSELGPMGVSMFFLSTTLAQTVYAIGGSAFAGANGSMMIEVVPFFHILANDIASQIGENNPKEILATTLAACIGGVGAFLIQTGVTVSMRIGEDDLGADWKTIETMFLDTHNLTLWVVPLILAMLLRAITHRFHHQLIFPIFATLGLDLWDLRRTGWIFDMGTGESESWYKFYSYWDFKAIRFGVLWATLFFNILHPPLNVPALSVSLDEDVDTDKELVAHGFYRVGGTTRIAGFLLAVMTAVLLVIGTAPIAYIPVMVVGSLIFVLGIDLVKEALWDTRHRTSRTEYITIVSIIIVMTVWDFVIGVTWGIIASCFFFVVQNSQRRSIRSLHSGETAMSTVRRPSLQRAYLREVSKQTTIITLQGFLFFGTISHVEDAIRDIVDGSTWYNNPVRFLLLDFTLVAGVDMSSSEAFVRMHRFLSAKSVTIVFCGFSGDSAVAQALKSVHVLGADDVEHFLTFNDAMEWTENAYLRAWYMTQKYERTSTAFALPGRYHREYDHSSEHFLESFVSSPRRSYMQDVGNRTIAHDSEYPNEPQNTLFKAFSSYGDLDLDLFRPINNYLERMAVPEGYVLWKQADPPDGLYIIESGVLRASYKFADHLQHVEESMVPGTVAGELSALSALPRNATVVVERAATLWKLSIENLARMEVEEPRLARYFIRLILKAAKIDHDILLSALASRQ